MTAWHNALETLWLEWWRITWTYFARFSWTFWLYFSSMNLFFSVFFSFNVCICICCEFSGHWIDMQHDLVVISLTKYDLWWCYHRCTETDWQNTWLNCLLYLYNAFTFHVSIHLYHQFEWNEYTDTIYVLQTNEFVHVTWCLTFYQLILVINASLN